MKKFIIIFVLILSFFSQKEVFSNETTFSQNTGFELYKEQVENFCEKNYGKTDLNNEIILPPSRMEKFLDLKKEKTYASAGLEKAKKSYEKNMDSIFGCATNIINYRALKQIKEDLIPGNSKLESKLKAKLTQKMDILKQNTQKKFPGCKIESSNKDFSKKAVLNQTVLETCKYSFYLDYLRHHYKEIGNIIGESEKETTRSLIQKYSSKINKINEEAERIFRVYPLAFQSFSDYENNVAIHLLFELLEEDYKIFRLGLHKTLNPINQVIYKIHNAMRF